jgi:ubiquinone/menaquinone biosynthesis C-methylase UbiE
MKTELLQIRDEQKYIWDKYSPGWKKWESWLQNYMKPVNDEIVNSLDLKTSDRVLDVAAGTGEPGLTIASKVSQGNVVGSDLSPAMLKYAMENARQLGLNNYRVVEADACELPFEDNSFDKISCRFGFMFFPDMLQGAQEMYRVLKPGGKMVASVWGSIDDNPWAKASMGTVFRNLQLPPPPKDAPGPFRCDDPEMMMTLLRHAGFKNVIYKVIKAKSFAESTEKLWQYISDIAGPITELIEQAEEEVKQKINKEIVEELNKAFIKEGNHVTSHYQAILYTCEK